MTPDIWHLIEGALLLVLGTWQARTAARASKLVDLELRLVKVETRTDAHADGLGRLQEGLDDVREHMVRREDLEALRRALTP